MKVSYKIVGVAGYTSLFNESAGDACSLLRPSFEDDSMVSAGFGSDSKGVTPQSNTIVNLHFDVVKIYATPQDALAAVRLLRAALKGRRLHLQVTQDAETQFYPNGALKSMTPAVVGKAVEYSFSFETEDVTQTAPTT